MTLAVSGTVADAFRDWPHELVEELRSNVADGRVGDTLVSESDRVRVWHIDLAPGERLPFHRHVLDYFWTAVTPGRARSYYADGSCVEFEYRAGDSRHFRFAEGEEMVHNLINVGDSRLAFVTVEFKDGSNAPLELPEPAGTPHPSGPLADLVNERRPRPTGKAA